MKRIKEICKKTLAAALCAATLLASANLPQIVYAAENTTKYEGEYYEIRTSGEWQYIVVNKEAVIVKCNSDASAIAVPEKLDECTVTSVGYLSDRYGDIGSGAFEDNSSMQTVTIPGTVKKIATEAFKNCIGLQQVLVGEGIENIGKSAFEGCKYMQKIQFKGNTLKTIDSWAFNGCEALDNLTIPTSVTTISDHAFSNCTALSEIVIPDSVTTLGGAAFLNCKVLTSAVIGNGVESLPCINYWRDYSGNYNGDYSGIFENCTSLLSVEIGSSVSLIGIDTFANTALLSIDIPENVVTIEAGAFIDCKKLKTAVIGNGTKTIGDWAFIGCNALESVSLGSSVRSIGIKAFSHDTSLKEITIPSSVTTLGGGCFYNCTSLSKAVIGNGVESLPYANYWRDYSGNNNGDRSGMFENCVSLSAVEIGDGVKSIGTDAFANTALTQLDIPDGVITLEDGIACNCSKLKSVNIGNGVTTVGDYAFGNDAVLENISIGSGVTNIGTKAFAFCPSIKELLIPSNVVALGAAICYKDTGLEKCIVGNGVTEIVSQNYWRDYSGNCNGDLSGAFENCVSLKDITLGSGLTSIGVDSFAGTKVSSVVIPSKVSTLGDGAFYNSEVTKAYFTGNAPSTFGKNVFYNTPGTVTYNIAGKLGYDDIGSYSFSEFTPVKVKFELGDVFAISPNDQLMAPEGGYVIKPINPVSEGYLFLGWYHDDKFTTPWNFLEDKVTEDTTIYAKWIKTIDTVPVAPTDITDVENTDTTATISWKEVSGATSYRVYLNGSLVKDDVKETSCKLTSLKADSAYEVTITAVNDKGESDASLVKVIYTAEKSEENGDDDGNDDDGDDDNNNGDDGNDDNNNGDENGDNNGGDNTGDKIIYGDVNQDGKCNLQDASAALKIALGIENSSGDAVFEATDVDKDDKITLTDVTIILKAALGIINL